MSSRPSLAQRAVQTVDGQVVDVHGHGVVGVLGGDARVAAVVAPMSQASRAAARGGGLAARTPPSRATPRPCRCTCRRSPTTPSRSGSHFRPPIELRQPLDVGLDQLGVEPGVLEVALARLALGGLVVAALELRVELDVLEHAAPHARRAWPRPASGRCRRGCPAAAAGSRSPRWPAASADRGTACRTGGSRSTARLRAAARTSRRRRTPAGCPATERCRARSP